MSKRILTTDAWLLERATCFVVNIEAEPRDYIRVERAVQRDGAPLWAIRRDGDGCLSKSGSWDWEPQPSSRTDKWLLLHRWSDRDEAIVAALAALAAPAE